jgi:hypothetical protein
MSRNKIISIVVGAIVAIATFVALLWLMIFGDMIPKSDLIFMVSLAISPLAVISVIAGFLVWWVCLFLLSLLWNDPGGPAGNGTDE